MSYLMWPEQPPPAEPEPVEDTATEIGSAWCFHDGTYRMPQLEGEAHLKAIAEWNAIAEART